MKKRIFAVFLVSVLLLSVFPSTVAFADNSEIQNGKPLAGKQISIIGDSISTYMGWSDSVPITDEDCAYRYGEPYYGPVESDCHNTELLVDDTWWYQSAQEMGAEILVNSSGNSTGLLYASYPESEEWQQYLQDMLTYKSRPYHLGKDGVSPDIIALYIGSNEVAKAPNEIGSVAAIDFDTLISGNGDGTYTYAEPETVAEAYCIMMHKLSVTYPDAEIYCFTVVPNSSGKLSICNGRLVAVYSFNEMVKDVAELYDAIVVDVYEAFALDPDNNGVAVQEDFDVFQTYFNGDPHPNASGFDVISGIFTETVLENSKYVVQVETTAGNTEYVGVNVSSSVSNGIKEIIRDIKDFITENGMTVDYHSEEKITSDSDYTYSDNYTSVDRDETYEANGGAEITVSSKVPELSVDFPKTDTDDERTEVDETKNTVYGKSEGIKETTGDIKNGESDGVYDFTNSGIMSQGSVSVDILSVLTQENIIANDHSNMSYVKSNTVATENNNLVLNYPSIKIPQNKDEVPAIPEEYEYVYIGSDKISNFYAAYLYNTRGEEMPNEEAVYSDDQVSLFGRADHNVFVSRNLVVPKLYLGDRVVSEEGKSYPARYDSIQQFTLSDANANIITAYCADQTTPAIEGYGYRIVNLEDATYYSKDEAEMIRSITNHGYWGTDSGFGSLAAVKQFMTDSEKFTEDEVARLTDGMAMTATQYAIWTFSNVMDEMSFINVYYTENAKAPSKTPDDDTAALIFKLYNYLVNLEPTSVSNDSKITRKVIINEKNFIDSISLKVTGKPEDNIYNLDDDSTNDVYEVDISFALSVKPSTENDDNLVMVIKNGDTVVAKGRIAGEAEEGEIVLTPDDNGIYTFHNVLMKEGESNIQFAMDGYQNLDKTAYLFTSEVKDDEASQTFVAIAEGYRNVSVAKDIRLEMNVEDEAIFTERIWRNEKTVTPAPRPTDPDPEPTPNPTEPTPQPTNPPVTPPDTGDNSNITFWCVLLVVSVIGLAFAIIYGKKRKN